MINLPEAMARRPIWATGTPGAGKSASVVAAIVIPDLERKNQVVIIDPTNAHFGLALSKSGKKPSGYNITVFGGENGSVALTPNMGRAMGELLGREPISAILSIWHFSLEDQINFVSEFMAAIMEVNRKPIRLVIDEADEFIPQKPEMGKELFKCKSRTKRVVTRGRKSGFRPVLLTQRPQALDTSVRNGCQVMMVFQCVGHHEVSQVEDYTKNHGDPKKMVDMLSTLGQLSVGEAWVWCPREKYLKRIQFPMPNVFDSWKEMDEESTQIKTIPVSDKHLNKISAALAEFEAQRKANDPVELRRKVADLSREIATLNGEIDYQKGRQKTAPIPQEALDKSYARGAEAMNKTWMKYFNVLKSHLDPIKQGSHSLVNSITNLCEHVKAPPVIPEPLNSGKPDGIALFSTAHPLSEGQKVSLRGPKKSSLQTVVIEVNNPVVNGEEISNAERKIMKSLQEWRSIGFDAPTREQVAALASYHHKTSSFTTGLALLRQKALIDYGDGTIYLTTTGKDVLPQPLFSDTWELHQRLAKTFDNAQERVFEALKPHGQTKRPREDLATDSGYHVKTSSFTTALAKLRSKDIIDYGNGTVFLKPWVFLQKE